MPEQRKRLSEGVTARIIKKSWEDPSFRRKLLSAPKQALEEELGVVFPAHVTVYVHEETENTIHLVLPKQRETTALASPASPPQTRRQLELQLWQKSVRDERFRALLFSEPKKAIEEEYGETVHPSIEIYVHEQTEAALHIVLPWNPIATADGSLDELELEKIAGGVLNCYSEALNTNVCTGGLIH